MHFVGLRRPAGPNGSINTFAAMAKPLNELGQTDPVDQLHRVVVRVFVVTSFKKGHDVRMVQLGGRADFVLKAVQPPLVERGGRRKPFERHFAPQGSLACFIDNRRPASTDLSQYLEIAEFRCALWRCDGLGPGIVSINRCCLKILPS